MTEIRPPNQEEKEVETTEIRPPNQEEQEVVEVKRKPSAVVR